MSAKARESRGQGTADARVEMRLSHDNGTTHGAIHTDVAISGRAAAMGQGIIADVSARLIDTFAANLAQMLAAPEREAPAEPGAVEAGAAAGAAAGAEAPTAEFAAAAPPGAAPPEGAAPPAAARPASPPAPPAEAEGLPVLSIAGGVIANRLRNPKVIAGLAGAAVLVFALRRRRR
jgi:hypothetical protein